jgi:signal transduction histidine kinase
VDNRVWDSGAGIPQPGEDDGHPGGKLEIPPGKRQVEFHYTGLSLSSPERVRFRYCLEGVDSGWVDAGARRVANYAYLPPGDYRFRVTAHSGNGVWSQSEASMTVTVRPYFWQTWWFKLALAAGFTVGVVAFVRYVSFRRLQRQLRLTEQQAALQRERARIAKDIHDDLGANLTQIALLGELAQRDLARQDKATQRVGTISSTARQTIKSLDEIVWAVNPRNDTLSHLVEYTGQFALDYLQLAGIRCRLDFPDHIPARSLSADLRHNVFLAAKEALTNIVKHARATEVRLRVSVTVPGLELVLEDNGQGFEPAPDAPGADGLRNMRHRLTDIGGECRIESRPGVGTRVVLRLPWRQD